MKRRDALKAMGGLAGAATLSKLLPACGSDPGPSPTIVVLMMENRSYDHYLGARSLLEGKPGNGLTADLVNPNRAGDPVPIFAAGGGDAVCVLDPPHGWDSSRRQVNGGAMDGFVREFEAAHNLDGLTDSVSYLTRDHVPAAWSLADHYVSCDQWYASVLGPTLPNRMYWHTGTSNGIKTNEPVFSWQSVYHRLAAKGIEYAYYYGDVPVLAIINDIEGHEDRIFRMRDFFRHAEAGTLAPVVYIDPSFTANDDHPPHHPLLGQQLIAAVYQALATSPQWSRCLFVVTYDEHGGFYDHVAPPADAADEHAAEGFNQFGIRVPTIVAGPYIKQGEVISTRYDHTSMLKHLQHELDLAPLYARVDQASDLRDCFDEARVAAADPRPAAPIAAVEIDESVITDRCKYGNEKRYDHEILEFADRHPEIYGRFDERAHVRDYLYMIGDYLDRHNLGRIRRGR
jgi:phospholipase C